MNKKEVFKNKSRGCAGRRPFRSRLSKLVAMVCILAVLINVALPMTAWAWDDATGYYYSTITTSSSTVTADGTSYATITVTLISNFGQIIGPVTGIPVYLYTEADYTSSGHPAHSQITPVDSLYGPEGQPVTDGDGQLRYRVTDTKAETVYYHIGFGSTVFYMNVAVTFVPGPADAANSSVTTATPAYTTADGKNSVPVTVILRDANNNLAGGRAVSLNPNSEHSTVSPASATTNSSGVATFNVADTTAETVTYTVQDTTDNVTLSQTAQAEFVSNVADGSNSTVTASPAVVTADGSRTSTVTVALKTSRGTPATGKTVQLTPSSGANTVITPPTGGSGGGSPGNPACGTTNINGQVIFTVTDTREETVIYTATDTTDSVTIPQTASVSFSTNVADANQSTLSPDSAYRWADGSDTGIITVNLKTSQGSPATGKMVSLTANSVTARIAPASTGSNVTNSSGVATFTVTDTKAETVTCTATDTTDQAQVSTGAQVAFIPGPADATKSTLTVSPTRVAADGKSCSTITLTPRDAQGRLLNNLATTGKGQSVKLSRSGGNASFQCQENTWSKTPVPIPVPDSGVLTISVYDTSAETVGVSASGAGCTNLGTCNLTFYAPVATEQSAITADPASVPADGKSFSAITVTLKDASGNPWGSQTVSLAAVDGHSLITTVNATTNASGQATFRVTDTHAEKVTYTATDTTNGLTPPQTTTVTFTPVGADTRTSTVTAGPASVAADGKSFSAITVTLNDAYGNPLSGRTVNLSAGSGHSRITVVQGTTNSSGQAIFHVTDTRAEAVTYTAIDTTDGVTPSQTATVNFSPQQGVTPAPSIDTPVIAGVTSVSGTAAAVAAIELTINGKAPYTATASAEGIWTVTNLPALAAGDTVSVTAQAAGEAVSLAATTTVQATLVQTPIPVIDFPVSAGVTSVSGTAQANAAIMLTVNGKTPYSATTSAGRTWTIANLPPLAAGDTISVTAQAAGEAVSPAAIATVGGAGSGTQDDPYLIGTAAQLAAIQNTVGQNSYYRLTADIDLGGSAWTPLGDYQGGIQTQFAGHFDGDGHVISNLTINDMSGRLFMGLFGVTAPGSTISNVGLRNIRLYQGATYINGFSPSVNILTGFGGLAGANQGAITNCWVTGSITNNSNRAFGGLVGSNGAFDSPAQITNPGTITGCWAGVSVTASGNGHAAGLVADNLSGVITNCYATGQVTTSGNGHAAGLVYQNQGSINNCYATGQVNASGNGYAAGLVNHKYGGITNCYAAGSVTAAKGSSNAYGLVDASDSTSSYYDANSAGSVNSNYSSAGKTGNQMKQQATFSGWDFTNTWGIHEGLGYPYLRGVTPLPDVTVSANLPAGGTVSGGGTYNVGGLATVNAAANNGYTFTGWSDSSGNMVSDSAYYSFTMGSSDIVLVANFTPGAPAPTPTPTINTPIPAGATSVSGTAQAGASVVLKVNGTARPTANASTNGTWTVSGLILTEGDTISVTAQAAGGAVSPAQTATVASQVTRTPPPTITPVYYWATRVGGTAAQGAVVTLSLNGKNCSATADANGNWTVSGLSLFAGETISATAQLTGAAASLPVTTTVLSQTPAPAINTPVYAGVTSVSGTAAPNAAVVISINGTAQPAVNASATGAWTVSGLPALITGDIISATAQSPGVTVSSTQTTTVVGQAVSQTPAPTVNTPLYAGATSVSGKAAGNAAVVLSINGTAQPAVNASANGYWTVGGFPALKKGDIISVTAQASGKIVSQTITTVVAAQGGGIVISPASGSYASPLSVTISDSGLSGNQAVYYSTAGDPESVSGADHFGDGATSCVLTLNGPATVYARVYGNGKWGSLVSASYNVSIATYPLTVQASPATDGSVSGGGAYAVGAKVPLAATAKSGYKFVNWTDFGGNVVSDSASFDYTMPAASTTLTANFQAASQANTLTVLANSADAGSVSGGGTYPAGASVSLTATANSGYTFVNWTDANGKVVSFSASFNYTMPATSTALTANFTAAGPTSMTISGYTITDRKHQTVTGALRHGDQYTVSMTVQNTSMTVQNPMLLIQVQQGGQVIELNSVQTQVDPNGSTTVSAMFTPQAAGPIELHFFAWSDWTDLGGQPLAVEERASEEVQ